MDEHSQTASYHHVSHYSPDTWLIRYSTLLLLCCLDDTWHQHIVGAWHFCNIQKAVVRLWIAKYRKVAKIRFNWPWLWTLLLWDETLNFVKENYCSIQYVHWINDNGMVTALNTEIKTVEICLTPDFLPALSHIVSGLKIIMRFVCCTMHILQKYNISWAHPSGLKCWPTTQ